jgi:hypothetical protein
MICPRGFILVRNMKTGDIRPFFVKVREEDIIRTGEYEAARSDRITFTRNGSWLIEDHDVYTIRNMSALLAPSTLTLVSTRVAQYTVTLPAYVFAADSAVLISKASNGNTTFENCMVEAELIDKDTEGLSRTLRIRFVDRSGGLTSTNIQNVSGVKLSVSIQGYSENPEDYEE